MSGIVVGMDGSGHSQHALEWAMKEAVLRLTPLTVITVHPVAISYWGTTISHPQDEPDEERAREAAQDAVNKVLAQLGTGQPADVTVRAISGMAAEELIEASREAELLVVGSRGTGGFGRLLMGSVSSQVAHHAHCPVVIIPAPRHM